MSQWFKKVQEEGLSALRSRREESGRRLGLSDEDLTHLEACLKRRPEAYGFRGEVWTLPRVREVIRQEFDLTYSPRHVGRLLKKIEWSRQKPAERADQRDDAAVAKWREETLPELKKKPPEKDGPSASSTKPVSTCCPALCARGPRGGRLRCCATATGSIHR